MSNVVKEQMRNLRFAIIFSAIALIGPGLTPAQTGCPEATAGKGFVNVPFATQTGTFTATFDATPSVAPINSPIGFSNGAATSNTKLATVVAISDSGDILALNGGTYTSETTIPYAAGVAYHFEVDVNLTNHTYSVFVTPAGGSQMTVATNYAFRTAQNTVTSLNNLGFDVSTSSGTVMVCNLSFGSTSNPSFSLSASPSSQEISAGSSASYTVSVTPSGGFTGTVDLAASGLPSGATAIFDPQTIAGSGSSTLDISGAPAGSTSTILITGTSGTLSETASVGLTVESGTGSGAFSLSLTPMSKGDTAGANAQYGVTVTPNSGFNGTVTFSGVGGLPAGATASFSPTSVASGSDDISMLTVSTDSSTPAGTKSLTFTGSSGSNSVSAEAGLTMAAPGTSNGNPVLPPKWAFGVLWGSYHDEATVLSDAKQLQTLGFGGDLYWIDSSWLSSSYTGQPQNYVCFKYDSVQFPNDPAGQILNGTLWSKYHLHGGAWEWPMIDEGCEYYSVGKGMGCFMKNSDGSVCNGGGWHGNKTTGVVNFSNPACVAWWESLHAPLIANGFTFIKMDTGCNGCGLSQAACREAPYKLSATTNGGRGFTITHTQSSTNADQSPGMWTGDTTASFSGMKSEMSTASKLSPVNQATYYCGDTGGYNDNPTPELYIRWLEYTTFTPIQEFFGAKTTSYGARFPFLSQLDDGMTGSLSTVSIALKYNQLRYRLLPFRYSNAQIAYHVTGAGGPVTWIGSTQLINGTGSSQILTQPVTSAGASSVSVTLPSGNWINYWTGGAPVSGTVSVSTPLDEEPVFVKAGSIIPMGPVVTWVDPTSNSSPMTLDTYPAGRTSYTLYEDDGVTTAYQSGAFTTTVFTSDNTSGVESLSIGAASGSFNGAPTSRQYILKINLQTSAPSRVSRDGVALPEVTPSEFPSASTGWYYDSTNHIVWVIFSTPTSVSTTVTLD